MHIFSASTFFKQQTISQVVRTNNVNFQCKHPFQAKKTHKYNNTLTNNKMKEIWQFSLLFVGVFSVSSLKKVLTLKPFSVCWACFKMLAVIFVSDSAPPPPPHTHTHTQWNIDTVVQISPPPPPPPPFCYGGITTKCGWYLDSTSLVLRSASKRAASMVRSVSSCTTKPW